MINIISLNLFIIIVILTLSGWLVLPTCGINTLLLSNGTKSMHGKIHKAAGKEFVISNSSNILRNPLNREKNVTLIHSLEHDSTHETFEKNSWQLRQTLTEKHGSSVNGSALRSVLNRNVKIHNEISKSNQENNLNNKKNRRAPTHLLSNIKLFNSSTLSPSPSPSSSSSSSPIPAASSAGTESIVPSYFERVEVHETLTHTKNEKFLLHRKKRYLLFPEGSSFQLVFDLIIPIVDYTNFAIMGITCAVAWELPSKPPSEIIESFRTKLNDGTYGISRRNSSTSQPLEYINSEQNKQEATDGISRWIQDVTAHNQQYLPQLSATIATTSGNEHFITNSRKQPLSRPSSNFYYNNYSQREKIQQPTATPATFFYSQHPQQQQWYNYETTFDTNQRRTLYANNSEEGPSYRNESTSPVSKQFYYKDHNHHSANKWHIKNLQQQMHQHEKPAKMNYNDVGGYWNRDNWWKRNKNRIEKHWQKNQQKWSHHEENKRKSRNRRILNEPPKHRIYPIFGKRRRRHSSANSHHDDVTEKLQAIHTGEHLRTRQKLYGKIEKLYETRGQNGTACVLRALCETAKRMHLSYHHSKAPQSFVMEILRSIFELPKDMITESKESSSLHVDDRYMNAVSIAQDVTKNCSEQYNDCEYSITFDS